MNLQLILQLLKTALYWIWNFRTLNLLKPLLRLLWTISTAWHEWTVIRYMIYYMLLVSTDSLYWNVPLSAKHSSGLFVFHDSHIGNTSDQSQATVCSGPLNWMDATSAFAGFCRFFRNRCKSIQRAFRTDSLHQSLASWLVCVLLLLNKAIVRGGNPPPGPLTGAPAEWVRKGWRISVHAFTTGVCTLSGRRQQQNYLGANVHFWLHLKLMSWLVFQSVKLAFSRCIYSPASQWGNLNEAVLSCRYFKLSMGWWPLCLCLRHVASPFILFTCALFVSLWPYCISVDPLSTYGPFVYLSPLCIHVATHWHIVQYC